VANAVVRTGRYQDRRTFSRFTAARIVKLLIAVVFFTCTTIRGLALRVAGYPTTQPFVVLMYHSVKRHERARFASQMNRLSRAGRLVYADFNAADLHDIRHIAVTFDDAYHSVFENAFPILRERSIPGTFFVPTQFVGSSPGWITDDRHRDVDERVLTADELREMRHGGALIGSHSVTHRRMSDLSETEVLSELTESRDALGQILGESVHLFALPYGSGNADAERLAASAGYTRVFLNVPTPSGRAPGQVVGRIGVDPFDWPLEYYLKIRGAYQWLPAALSVKRWVLNVLRPRVVGSPQVRRSRRATSALFPLP
jgi:peptidoglycan/xylan/chitin deacetylase (PgdA/CDA1 family)